MDFRRRIWRYLPGFLQRAPLDFVTQGLSHIMGAIVLATAKALGLVWEDIDLLKARGMGGRVTGYDEYYGSDERKADLVALGESRWQGKRPPETWEQFEARMAGFGAAVAEWGTKAGMRAELERLGLLVVSITEMNDDHDRWIMRTQAGNLRVPNEERSQIYTQAGQPAKPPEQRDCRIYAGETEHHTFKVVLGAAQGVPWSGSEVVAVVRMAKPAYTRGLAKMPGEQVYTEVL